MRFAIFSATGRLGGEVVGAALARGHLVVAHSRRQHEDTGVGVAWVTGSPTDAMQDADAVLVTFGPRSTSDAPFCAFETGEIIEATPKLGRKRLLCVTGAMIGDYRSNRTWCFERMARWIKRRYPTPMQDRAEQEALIGASDLDWTIFKPPRLADGPGRRLGHAGSAIRVGILSSISRRSLARLMVEEAETGRFIRQIVFAKG